MSAGYISGFEADDPPEAIATTLLENGSACIANLVAPEVMDQVYAEIEEGATVESQKSDTRLWPEGNKTLGALAATSSTYVEKLIVHPLVLEIVDLILRPAVPMIREKPQNPQNFEIAQIDADSTQVVIKPSAEIGPNCDHYNLGAGVMLEVGAKSDQNQVLHRENAIYQPYVEHLDMREFIVSTMWAGTDFTKENGATRVVPGSHRWPEDRIAKEDEIVQAVMPKGSVVLWLSRTLHGAAGSQTGERRTGFFASYIPDWFRQEENQLIAVAPEIAEHLPDRARRLVGYSSSPTLGWVKGRDQNNLLMPGTSGPIG
ncbi:MAG: phytanoyl-CoA dioxygenase family protein [Pseudomonadota bacterium]|nr:phytanoyl-CoA dioxygenase family protein [Pseudomonadota bacterium]